MLGGLSGFKPKKIPNIPSSFDEYYNNRNDIPWAQDQFLMVSTFIYSQDREFTRHNFLDCPINNQQHPAVFPCTQLVKENTNDIEFNDQQEHVLDIIERNNLCTWAGEPCDVRGDVTNELVNLDCEMSDRIKEAFKSDKMISEFYRI